MINQTSMVGRLVDDPQVKYSNNGGKTVANFKLAVQRPYKDQNNNKPTDFIPCVVWGPQADFLANSSGAKKGKLLAVSGRMQSRDYEHSQYPIKVYVIELNCDEVQVMEWDDNGQQNGGNNNQGGYSNNQNYNNNNNRGGYNNQNYNNNNQGNYGNNNQNGGYNNNRGGNGGNNQGYSNNQNYGNQGYNNQGYNNNQNYNNNQPPQDQGRYMEDPFAKGQSIDIKDDDLPF